MRKWYGLLRAGRHDSVLFCVGLLVLWAIAFPILVVWDLRDGASRVGLSAVGLSGLLGMLLALAVIVGSPSRYLSGDRWAALLGIPLMVLALVWSGHTQRIWGQHLYEVYRRPVFDTDWLTWAGMVSLLIAFGTVIVLLLVGQRIIDWLSRLMNEKKLTRSHVLIGLAVFLFVLTPVGKSMYFFGRRNGWQTYDLRIADLQGVIAGAVLFGVVLPSLVISRLHKLRYRVVAAGCLWGSIFSVSAVCCLAQSPGTYLGVIALWCFCVSIAFPLVLVSQRTDIGSEEDAEKPAVVKGSGRWVSPLGCGLGLTLLMSVVWFVQKYDVRTLIMTSTNRWELAHQVRVLESDAGTELYGDIDAPLPIIRIYFSDQSDPRFVERLSCIPSPVRIEVNNLNSQIDMASLKSIPRVVSLSLKGGEVTVPQIQDVDANVAQVAVTSVKGASSDSTQATLPLTKPWTFVGNRPGETAEFLRCMEGLSNQRVFSVAHSELNMDDWSWLVKASQTCPVHLRWVTLPRNLYSRMPVEDRTALSNMQIEGLKDQDPQGVQLALGTNVGIQLVFSARDEDTELYQRLMQDYWASRLLTGFGLYDLELKYQSLPIHRTNGKLSSIDEFTVLADENFWTVAKTEDGSLESIYFPGYLPQLVADLGQLPNLKRLGLDTSWLQSRYEIWPIRSFKSLSQLGELRQLEVLHLSYMDSPEDLRFLSTMPKLRELQISSLRADLSLPGFEQCQSLEKLTLLGSPGSQTLSEIAKIPTLKHLTIVDFYQSFVDPKIQETLRKKMKGVEVEIMSKQGYLPPPTKEFLEHQERVRKLILPKYLDD